MLTDFGTFCVVKNLLDAFEQARPCTALRVTTSLAGRASAPKFKKTPNAVVSSPIDVFIGHFNLIKNEDCRGSGIADNISVDQKASNGPSAEHKRLENSRFLGKPSTV